MKCGLRVAEDAFAALARIAERNLNLLKVGTHALQAARHMNTVPDREDAINVAGIASQRPAPRHPTEIDHP